MNPETIPIGADSACRRPSDGMERQKRQVVQMQNCPIAVWFDLDKNRMGLFCQDQARLVIGSRCHQSGDDRQRAINAAGVLLHITFKVLLWTYWTDGGTDSRLKTPKTPW